MKRLAIAFGALLLFGCAHDADRGTSSGTTPVTNEPAFHNGSDTSGIGNNGTFGSGMTSGDTRSGTYQPGQPGSPGPVGPSDSVGSSTGVMDPGQPGTSNAGPAAAPRTDADSGYPSLGAGTGASDEGNAPQPRKHRKHKKGH